MITWSPRGSASSRRCAAPRRFADGPRHPRDARGVARAPRAPRRGGSGGAPRERPPVLAPREPGRPARRDPPAPGAGPAQDRLLREHGTLAGRGERGRDDARRRRREAPCLVPEADHGGAVMSRQSRIRRAKRRLEERRRENQRTGAALATYRPPPLDPLLVPPPRADVDLARVAREIARSGVDVVVVGGEKPLFVRPDRKSV